MQSVSEKLAVEEWFPRDDTAALELEICRSEVGAVGFVAASRLLGREQVVGKSTTWKFSVPMADVVGCHFFVGEINTRRPPWSFGPHPVILLAHSEPCAFSIKQQTRVICQKSNIGSFLFLS